MTESPFAKPSSAKTMPTIDRRGDAEARAEVPRDQWGRYLVPNLDGTKPPKNKGRTRVSTTKQALSNTIGIQKWTNRLVAEGVALDDDIRGAIVAAMDLVEADRKTKVGQLADKAFARAGGKDRSKLGTAVHEATEQINQGKTDVQVPEQYRADVDAYYQVLKENNVRVLPYMLERIVLCPYNNAGTFDNMVEWWNPDTEEWELLIADLKTGRSLDLGWLEILMQLWMYANALGIWTTTKIVRDDNGEIIDVEGFYEPMPRELRTDKAGIIHVPMNGEAEWLILDLGGVEEAIKAAVTAKRWNAEAKYKVRSVGKVTAGAFVVDKAAPLRNTEPSADEQRLKAGMPVREPGAVYTTEQVGNLVAEGIMHGRSQTEVPVPGGTMPEHLARSFYPDNVGGPAMVPGVGVLVAESRRPTPDQQAQADKAAERLLKVSNPPTLPAEHPEPDRDPVTGRKKRTCGHCRKPGHTQKNCPENPDSPKYVGPGRSANSEEDQVTAGQVVTDLMRDHNDRIEQNFAAPGPLPAVPDSAYGPDAVDLPLVDHEHSTAEPSAAYPYCRPGTDHSGSCQWTSQVVPGHWVCATTGKPSQIAYLTASTEVTNQPPLYGAPPAGPEYSVGDTVTVAGIDFTKHSEGPTWAAPEPKVDHVLAEIARATMPDTVLVTRANAMQHGLWNQAIHDQPAMLKYQELLSQQR